MKTKPVKNNPSLMDTIREHLENIRPCNKPNAETINAAGKASSLVNSAVRHATFTLRAAQLQGQQIDLREFGVPIMQPKAIAEKN